MPLVFLIPSNSKLKRENFWCVPQRGQDSPLCAAIVHSMEGLPQVQQFDYPSPSSLLAQISHWERQAEMTEASALPRAQSSGSEIFPQRQRERQPVIRDLELSLEKLTLLETVGGSSSLKVHSKRITSLNQEQHDQPQAD